MERIEIILCIYKHSLSIPKYYKIGYHKTIQSNSNQDDNTLVYGNPAPVNIFSAPLFFFFIRNSPDPVMDSGNFGSMGAESNFVHIMAKFVHSILMKHLL